ncbi:hypothetical protein Taro_027157 [Colocasia esculenta]|uniref:Uncharacterized protein n=1 Tax=Colocasia esculenta TaxID=4460 RepID=A0A843VLP6_COLES|nr:hypothetical protein [Colocasia esculenta]
MIGTWSEEEDDEDEENSEDDENESIICLMARESSNDLSFYKSRSTLLDTKVDSTSLPSKFLKNKLPVRSTLLDSKVNSTSLLSKFLKNKLPVRSTLAESKVDTSCHPVNWFWRYSQEVDSVC